MKRALALLAAINIAAAAACSSGGSGGGRGGGLTGPQPGWPMIAASLSDGLDPASPNICNQGATGCLDEVVNEMTRRLDRLVSTCDHGAPFVLAYLDVTTGLRDAERSAGDAGPAVYLRHLDAVFAKLDFTAADGLAAGHSDAVPRVWQIAYDAASGRQVTGIGDLLLGMNAHISRDLAFAVAAVGTNLPDGTSAKSAFDTVNQVIASVQQPMLDEVARRFDPTVASADLSTIGFGGSSVGQLIGVWRDEAWANGARLRAASAADRPSVAASIDNNATARSLALVAATHYVPLISSTAARDQFCAAHGRG